MPLPVKTYSDMLMDRVIENECNVFLVNTGMNSEGKRFPLNDTRNCIKKVLDYDYEIEEMEWTNPIQPCKVGTITLYKVN